MSESGAVIIDVPVATFRQDAYCEQCLEEGVEVVLEYTGIVKPMHPPIYMHQCTECKDAYSLSLRYPRITHKTFDEIYGEDNEQY
jgi:hypothetical protein